MYNCTNISSSFKETEKFRETHISTRSPLRILLVLILRDLSKEVLESDSYRNERSSLSRYKGFRTGLSGDSQLVKLTMEV